MTILSKILQDSMECDQWALLYEQERSLRLQIEKDHSLLMDEYINLFFYLLEGRRPLVFDIDGTTGMYLVS